jgi:hypothetical protein
LHGILLWDIRSNNLCVNKKNIYETEIYLSSKRK